MKLFAFIKVLSLCLLVSFPLILGRSALAREIRVVTTIPDLADMTRQIGKELVAVESLTTGVRSLHRVQMKPSFVPKLKRADILVVMGLYLEQPFLPGLLDVANNPRVSVRGPGYIDTSRGITPIEVPATLSRIEGDIHPEGNPHYNLDPMLGLQMARNIAHGLARNYPEHEEVFMANLREYRGELDRWIQKWTQKAQPLEGKKFVAYHKDLGYFAKRYGMGQVGTIELKPGIAPTPSHLVGLVARMKAERVPLVLYSTVYSPHLPQRIATEAGAKVVGVPIYVNGRPGIHSYIQLIDDLVTTVAAAVGPN